jgi:tetratricopeptide (TPR) repeat protein
MRNILIVAALYSAVAMSGSALAGDQPIMVATPDWVQPMVPELGAPVAASPVLLSDRQIRFERDKTTTYIETMVRLNSAEMLTQLGTLTLDWHPTKSDLLIHKVELIRASGSVDVLKSGQKFAILRREAQLERLQLNGRLTATLQIEGAQVGDILHLSFSITHHDPALGGYANAFQPLRPSSIPVPQTRLRALWESDRPVAWKVTDDHIKPKLDKIGNYTTLSITGPLPEAAKLPSDVPARYRFPDMLLLSDFPSWSRVSAISAPHYDPKDMAKGDASLMTEIGRIAAESTDQKVRAAGALRVVQDKVRYLFNGLALGDYIPATPTETWTRRYGDCKAKTLLLLAMLKELGVPAEAVLVSATYPGAATTALPGFQMFDHVIVRATANGKTLWLDGTMMGDRIEDVEDVPAFGAVLPIRASGAELETITPTPPARPLQRTDVDIDARAGVAFPAPYSARITLRGQSLVMLRYMQANTDAKQFAEFEDGFISGVVPNGTISDRAVTFNDATGEATITGSGIANMSWAINDGRRAAPLGTILSDFSINTDRSDPKYATIPVPVAFPNSKVARTVIHLPKQGAGFTLTGNPRYTGTLAGSEITRAASLKDGVVTLNETVRAKQWEIAPSAIPEARTALAKAQAELLRIAAPENYPTRAAEIADAKKTGALKVLIAAYDRAVVNGASDSSAASDRAQFYEKIDEPQKALADVDRVIAINPTVDNYLWRARLRGEKNASKAIEDIQAARALDPKSLEAVQQLVELRYASKNYPAALSDIETAMETGISQAELLSLRSQVLDKAGRVDEAVAAIDKAIDLAPGKPAYLNERCWLKGTRNRALDTALKDCTRAIDLMDDPTAALDSRGFVYLRMQRYDDAIADFDAALKREPGLGASLFARGIARLRKGDKVGGDADLIKARAISATVDKTYAEYGVTP